MDIREPFTKNILKWAPNCKIVFNKLHVMQHTNKGVDQERRAEFYPKGGQKRGFIIGERWLLLTQWFNVDGDRWQILNDLFRQDRKMMKAHLLEEGLDGPWTYRYEGQLDGTSTAGSSSSNRKG